MQPKREHAGPPANDALGWEIARQEARAYLERVEKEVSTALGQMVDVRLEQGRPSQRIVDLAREMDAQLTMLGSRGDGAAAPQSLGSTVQQVLSLARNSLFIVSASSSPSRVAPKRILVPLDGSLRTESVLPAAARIAKAQGAELLLVHVVQEPLPSALLDAPEDMELARTLASRLQVSAERYLENLRQRLAREVTVRALVVRHPNEYQCLLEISQKEHPDLVLLSAHGAACDSARSFGTVTFFLLTHAAVPLLVLQDLPDPEVRRAGDAETTLAPPSPRASYAPESV